MRRFQENLNKPSAGDKLSGVPTSAASACAAKLSAALAYKSGLSQPTTSSPGVVVIGSMSADMTTKSDRLPRPGETIVGSKFTLVSGGKGGNQAVMSAHLGVPTYMVGCVGDDVFRSIVLETLRGHGVDTTFITVLPDAKTGIAHIRVDDSGQNDIVIVPHANLCLDGPQIDRFFASGPALSTVLLQLEIPLDSVIYAAKQAKERGLYVILDPAPAVELPAELYQTVDLMTPNETEAEALTGIPVRDAASAAQAAQVLRQRGVPTVIITLGGQGVYVMTEDGQWHLPTPTVPVVDTTAAGDAFTGALGACLAQGLGLQAALPIALAAGAYTVTTMGAQSSLPSKLQVEQLRAESTSNESAKDKFPQDGFLQREG